MNRWNGAKKHPLRNFIVFLMCAVIVSGSLPVQALAAADNVKKSELQTVIGSVIQTAAQIGSARGTDVLRSARATDVKVADPSTAQEYRNVLGTQQNGSRYAGRIWTDKSVFADSLDIQDNGIQGSSALETLDPAAGEDFGVVYSALGSSQVVTGEASTPIDLVLMLDISSSMCSYNHPLTGTSRAIPNVENYPISSLVNATNELMDEFLALNPENRIGIVVYGGGSQVLLPLDHYSRAGNSPYISLGDERHNNDRGHWYQAFYSLVATTDKGSWTSSIMNANATYLQGALYQGMGMLASAKNTTYTDVLGNECNKLPAIVVMTDGASNAMTLASGSNNWWNPIVGANRLMTVQSTNQTTNDYFLPQNWANSTPNPVYIANGPYNQAVNRPRNLSTLMTAAYMKKQVTENYASTQSPQSMQGYAVAITSMGMTETDAETLHVTLNPAKYFAGSAEQGIFNQFQSTGGNLVLNNLAFRYNSSSPQVTKSLTLSKNTTSTSKYNPTTAADFNYIDQYYEISAGTIGSIFQDILTQLSARVFHPLRDDEAVTSGIRYVDELGPFMEIKDVRGVSVFGRYYEASENGNGGYTLPQTSIVHPAYIDDTPVNLADDVTINVSRSADVKGIDSLTVTLAEQVLPIMCTYVELSARLDANGNQVVRSYTSNTGLGETSSLPFRIYYTVGVKDELRSNDGKVSLAKLNATDPTYVATHRLPNGSVYFLCNNYPGGQAVPVSVSDGQEIGTAGTATASFVPAELNRYFYYGKHRVIYASSNLSSITSDPLNGAQYIGTGGPVTVSDPVTGSLNPDQNYYVIMEFYEPANTAGGGRYVQWVLQRSGRNLIDWTGTYQTDSVFPSPSSKNNGGVRPGSTVTATNAGFDGLRVADLSRFVTEKTSNPTNTADLVYQPDATSLPTNSRYVFQADLGNNGRLSIADTTLTITKALSVPSGIIPDNWQDQEFSFRLKLKESENAQDFFTGPIYSVPIKAEVMIPGTDQKPGLIQPGESGQFLWNVVEGEQPQELTAGGSNEYTITLKPGQGVVLLNLPPGGWFELTENSISSNLPDGYGPDASMEGGKSGVLPESGILHTVNVVNVYGPTAVLEEILVSKTVTPPVPASAKFRFELTPIGANVRGQVPMPVSAEAGSEPLEPYVGEIEFPTPPGGEDLLKGHTITYTQKGEYYYLIRELPNTDAPGVSTDPSVYLLTVTVESDGNNELKATAKTDLLDGKGARDTITLEPTFTNHYNALETDIPIAGVKFVKNGGYGSAGGFTFTLTGEASEAVSGTQEEALRDSNTTADKVAACEESTYAASDNMPMPPRTQVESGTNGDIYFGVVHLTGDDLRGNPNGIIYKYQIQETGSDKPGITKPDSSPKTLYIYLHEDDGVVHATTFGDVQFEFINEYSPEGVFRLPVTKTVENGTFHAGDSFTFELMGPKGGAIPNGSDPEYLDNRGYWYTRITVPAAGQDGGPATGASTAEMLLATLDYSDVQFTIAANKKRQRTDIYFLREEQGSIPGMIYDEGTYAIEITARDDEGQIQAEITNLWYQSNPEVQFKPIDKNGKLEFKNTYPAGAGDVGIDLSGTKTQQGGTMHPHDYVFEVRSMELDTGSNAYRFTQDYHTFTYSGEPDGNSAGFEILNQYDVRYSEPGKYFYHIHEVPGTTPGVIYDPREFLVEVNVTNGDDGLSAAVTDNILVRTPADNETPSDTIDAGLWSPYSGSKVEFANTVSRTGDAEYRPVVTKRITGAQTSDDEFTFTLKQSSPQDGVIMPDPATIAIEGADTAYFSPIFFTSTGDYTFQIVENVGDVSGVSYDRTTWTVTVPVVMGEDGQLIVDADRVVYTSSDGQTGTAAVFTNTYGPPPSQTPVNPGPPPVIPPGPAVTPETTPSASPSPTPSATLTPSPTVSQTPSPSPSPSASPRPDDTDVNVPAQKIVQSADGSSYELEGGEFDFILTPAPINPAADPIKGPVHLTNGAGGSFDAMHDVTFTAPGTYYYVLEENFVSVPGMQYTASGYLIKIEVTESDGKLVTEVTYTNENNESVDSLRFVNIYDPSDVSVTIPGTKTLKGSDLKEGQFSFVIEPVSAIVEPEARATEIPTEEETADPSDLQTPEPETTQASESVVPEQTAEPSDDIEYTETEHEDGPDETQAPDQTEQEDEERETADGAELDAVPTSRSAAAPAAAVREIMDGNEMPLDEEEISEGDLQQPERAEDDENVTSSVQEEEQPSPTASLDEDAIQEARSTELDINDIPMPAQGAVVNTIAGTFHFGPIDYTLPGVYTYKVHEAAGTDDGIRYDGTEYTVIVTVQKNEDGVLVASTEVQGADGIAFHNEKEEPRVTIVKDQRKNDGEWTKDLLHCAAGDVITYRLTVTNPASVEARDVIVTDRIPAGLTLVDGSISDGGTLSGDTITWNLGNIAPGGQKIVSFQVKVPSVTAYTRWKNAASVTYENNPDNGSDGTRVPIPSNAVEADCTPPSSANLGTGAAGPTAAPAAGKVPLTDDAGSVGLGIAMLILSGAVGVFLGYTSMKRKRS